MIKLSNFFISYFTSEFNRKATITLFRKLLYTFLLYNTISILPISSLLWSENSVIIPYIYGGWLAKFLNLLDIPQVAHYFWSVVLVQLLFLITGILNLLPKLSSVMIFISTTILINKMYLANTGGDYLISVLLFYLMFIWEANNKKQASTIVLQNTISNTFFLVVKIQIVLLYVIAGYTKLIDPLWNSGEAIFYTLKVDWYSHPILQSGVFENKYLLKTSAYFGIAYQLLFPIGVSIKKLKTPFLLSAVLFHLFIGIGMGLFAFSMTMMITYQLFFSEYQCKRVLDRLKRIGIKKAGT